MKFTRKFTEEERVKIVEEVLACGSNALIAAKYDINQVQISYWKCNYRRYGQTLKPKEAKALDKPIPDYKAEYKALLKEKQELELEVAILRDMLKKTPRNKLVCYS
ncbi:Transposase [Clostridium sp. DSM 8431]|uniref:helix-turn-helix domain-containing protein n=1 Tax=Clostridium sp. DSM 8431 TaxID=1761781 RepID=UPI0008ED67C1|nr:helix-turn-helix domain-containing protein [Clostridium sp. DSM 8431]SFU64857.1 Transposase [Clostridium sp. DSM 8431]